jgi:hypothetical protein
MLFLACLLTLSSIAAFVAALAPRSPNRRLAGNGEDFLIQRSDWLSIKHKRINSERANGFNLIDSESI